MGQVQRFAIYAEGWGRCKGLGQYKMQKKKRVKQEHPLSFSTFIIWKNSHHATSNTHTTHRTSIFSLFLSVLERTSSQLPSANRALYLLWEASKPWPGEKYGCLHLVSVLLLYLKLLFVISLPKKGTCKWEEGQNWDLGNGIW